MFVKTATKRSIARVYFWADFGGVEDTEQTRRAIAARIREARLRMGFDNASEFARQVGVTPTTLYRWESEAIAPDIFNLYDVARVACVTMEWLVGGSELEHGPALAQWIAENEKAATPQVRAFLASIPLLGRVPDSLFYDLCFQAWKSGLSPVEASDAAKQTSRRLQ